MQKKLNIALLIFLIFSSLMVSFVISNLSTSIFARIYAYQEGVPLEDLSEDYGLGFIIIFMFIGIFLISLPVVFLSLRKIIAKFLNKHLFV